ncbi:hypothetical protein NKH18_50560 [Streptomyces sp. M10(2022)]
MTDKYASQYDDPPEEVEETDEESDPSPDNGRDLSNMVPEVEVAWEDPPSFNTDPTDLSSDGAPRSRTRSRPPVTCGSTWPACVPRRRRCSPRRPAR